MPRKARKNDARRGLPRKYFRNGEFVDPRTKEELFDQCYWSVRNSNRSTIVKHSPLRVCMKNIFGITLPLTDEEIRTRVKSLEAQERRKQRVRAQRRRNIRKQMR